MANFSLRSITNFGSSLRKLATTNFVCPIATIHTAVTLSAARKGTREKARAKKVKVEIAKVGFIPHNLRGKDKLKIIRLNKHIDESKKMTSTDDVWCVRYFKPPILTAVDAIDCHKETHHPTMYNEPDAFVYCCIELNMEAVKKNRYIDSFQRLLLLPNIFPTNDPRTILAFAKDSDNVNIAMRSGATLAGGVEIVKQIQDGSIKISDYDYVIAHPNIITDLVPIRGLLKRKFPNPRSGTLDQDVGLMVKKLASGANYRAVQDEYQKNFGLIKVPVGRLNMPSEQIAENIETLIKDVNLGRPKRDGMFITRVYLTSPPSRERLRIDPFLYVSPTIVSSNDDESESDNEAELAVKI